MEVAARLCSRPLRARGRLLLTRPPSARLASTSAAPSTRSSSNAAPSRPKRLPEARPSWAWDPAELKEAYRNAKLRNASIPESEQQELEQLRPLYTEAAAKVKALGTRANELERSFKDKSLSAEDKERVRAEAKRVREELRAATKAVDENGERAMQIRLGLPNRTHPAVPIGDESKARVVALGGISLLPDSLRSQLEQHGLSPSNLNLSDFPASPAASPTQDHLNLATSVGAVDPALDRLASGPNWPFLLGPLALLEHALSHYALSVALRHGFRPAVVPDAVKTELSSRCGFNPREAGGAAQTYFLSTADEGKDTELCLAGTAEIPLAAIFAGLTLRSSAADSPPNSSPTSLPQAYVALSHAFRAEAGARGADTRGLYRVHQFSKAELFVVCAPSEGEEWLERLRAIQEEIVTSLGLPFRTLDMPSEELGASAYRKYDIEVWMPGRGSWGEVSSASLCTDYQSRRLGIRCQGPDGGAHFATTLNATAAAIPRLIVALLENGGVNAQGQLRLPAALRDFWLAGPQDASVEWVSSNGMPPSAKRGPVGSALDTVRRLAARSGTDPASMAAAFLVLHEVTALVPLVLLFYLLGALGAGEAVLRWLDASAAESADGERSWLAAKVHGWVQEGMTRAERYGRRKGWWGLDQLPEGELGSAVAGGLANAVAAYAIVKAVLPLRIAASIALSGPLARFAIEPIKRRLRSRAVK